MHGELPGNGLHVVAQIESTLPWGQGTTTSMSIKSAKGGESTRELAAAR